MYNRCVITFQTEINNFWQMNNLDYGQNYNKGRNHLKHNGDFLKNLKCYYSLYRKSFKVCRIFSIYKSTTDV